MFNGYIYKTITPLFGPVYWYTPSFHPLFLLIEAMRICVAGTVSTKKGILAKIVIPVRSCNDSLIMYALFVLSFLVKLFNTQICMLTVPMLKVWNDEYCHYWFFCQIVTPAAVCMFKG